MTSNKRDSYSDVIDLSCLSPRPVQLHETKWIIGLKFVSTAEQASNSLSNDIHNFIFLRELMFQKCIHVEPCSYMQMTPKYSTATVNTFAVGRNASSSIQKSGKQLSFHIVSR